MRILKLLSLLVCVVASAIGQDIKVYPGSQLDADSSRRASSAKTESEVYISQDGFDRVYAFYKALYPEWPFPVPPPDIGGGKKLRWAFFIVDGGKDLAHSKHWIKIQRPYIATVGDKTDFEGFRDVSVIQSVHR